MPRVKLEKPDFQAIPQFTREPAWAVDVGWNYLMTHVEQHIKDYKLQLEPDFQRAHVWTQAKRSAYVEYCLRGGRAHSDLHFNCIGWTGSSDNFGDYVIVDGKQRLHAIMGFMRNEVKAFGYYYKQFTGHMRIHITRVRWSVNDLATREQVLQWYLDMNTGGVAHTTDEIKTVEALLKMEQKKSHGA